MLLSRFYRPGLISAALAGAAVGAAPFALLAGNVSGNLIGATLPLGGLGLVAGAVFGLTLRRHARRRSEGPHRD